MFTWIVDSTIEDRNDQVQSLVLFEEAVLKQGHRLIAATYVPHSIETSVRLDDPEMVACAYGTIGFITQLRDRYPGLRPGPFYDRDEFSVFACEAKYGDMMLNDSTKIGVDPFPLTELAERAPALVAKHGPLFFRPGGVGKAFAGTVAGTQRYPVGSFVRYVEAYADKDRTAGEIVHVRRPVDIEGEYRFVCIRGNAEPIASSQYRYGGRLDKRIDIDPAALRFVQEFLRYHPGPAPVYVMDIAVTEDGPRIVEFNNFSSSGLYMCDRNAVVQHVTALCKEMADADQ